MSREIIAFCCEHSATPAANLAGRLGLHYSENLRLIPVPCAGRVDAIHILKAFEEGAAAVLVLGCEDGACHHIEGNTRARERVRYSRTLLEEIGIDGRRVGMFNLAPDTPHKFLDIVNETNETLKELGEGE